jgi:TIR domain
MSRKKIEVKADTIGQVVNIDGDNAQVIHHSSPVSASKAETAPKAVQSPQPKENQDISDIFMSYSRSDWQHVWVDQHLIEGGTNWQDEINVALASCRVLVLCVSSRALVSPFVQTEYRYFINHRKPLIPVMCEHVALLPELEGIQYLPATAPDKLVTRLKQILSS